MQATTRITRWQARHWRLRKRHQRPDRPRRTLTYREVWRRARVTGIYPRSPRGYAMACRDLWRALPPHLRQAVLTVSLAVPPRLTDRHTIAEDAQRLRG